MKKKCSIRNAVDPLDITKSCSVTASAGTGKTYNLTKRYVAVLKKGTKPENILCLTFTDKAAAEMREKIEEDIRFQLKDAKEKNNISEIHTLENAIDNIHRCSINTFHGFCSSILREFPIEAGVPVGYAIMDDFDQREIVRTTIKDILKSPPENLCKEVILLYTSLNESAIIKTIEKILGKWEKYQPWFDIIEDNTEELLKSWEKTLRIYLEETRNTYLNDKIVVQFIETYENCRNDFDKKKAGYTNAELVFSTYYELKEAATEEEIRAALGKISNIALRGDFPETFDKGVKVKYSRAKSDYKKKIEKCYRFISEIPREEIDFALAILKAFAHVSASCREKITTVKENTGYLNFDDLIQKTLHLLDESKNPSVVAELRKRYRYILVDEVQDNNPVLTEIVSTLAGDPDTNDKLFIVGDLKQSIYGFNNADPKKVNDLINTFSSYAELKVCRRIYEPVMDVINKIFEVIYPESQNETDDLDLRYPNITAHRIAEREICIDEKNAKRGTVTVIKNTSIGKAADATKAEAEILASWIYQKTSDPDTEKRLEVFDKTENIWRAAEFKDFAILVKSRTYNKYLKNALKKYKIPYQEYKGRNFYLMQEIFDIVSVIKAVMTPEDEVSLYGALKSPYFGISDVELAKATFKKGTAESLEEKLLKSGNPQIIDALTQIKGLKTCAKTSPLPAFLHKIVKDCGILSVYAAQENGLDKIANLNKFLSFAEDETASKSLTLFEFIRLIDTCIDEKIQEEEASADDTNDNRVKILTIHASKGLEYPIVILAFAGKAYYSKNSGLLTDDKYGIIYTSLKPYGKEDDDNAKILAPVADVIKKEKDNAELEEMKRLFYVALTRARDHLVITETETGDNGPAATSLMELYRRGIAEEEDTIRIESCCIEAEEKTEKTIEKPVGWDSEKIIVPLEKPFEPAVLKENTPTYLNTNSDAATLRGTCLHEIFAGADIEKTCKKYGLNKNISEFKEKYDDFLSSKIVSDIELSLCELPLFENSLGTRRIDRLVKKSDGTYLIIDYKTGDFWKSEEGREKYQKQQEEYSAMLSQVLGVERIPAVLYLIDEKDKEKRWMKIVE